MKKLLKFIPLGIGISALILYIFNIVNYRIINNAATMMQILTGLKTYLYISIGGFIIYFCIKIIEFMSNKSYDSKTDTIIDEVPIKEKKTNDKALNKKEKINENLKIVKKEIIKEVVLTGDKYCSNCGEKIFSSDTYCKRCGSYQLNKKSGRSPLIRNIINVMEIVILILILYFMVNILFEYKEKKDPSFTSPFKIEITK